MKKQNHETETKEKKNWKKICFIWFHPMTNKHSKNEDELSTQAVNQRSQ